MVTRTFFAFDNESLVVATNPNGGPAVGSAIINNVSTPDGTTFTFTDGGGAIVSVNDEGGDPDIFEDQDPTNHTIIDGRGLVADGASVESESIITVRALDEFGNQTGPTITINVFSEGGVSAAVWGFATDIPLVDGVSYVKTGGNNAGSSAYTDYAVCFAEGTMIDTPDGKIAVEMIKAGQLIWTRDSGPKPVMWASTTEAEGYGGFAPVVFAPGAIGNEGELVVSQQHRLLLDTPMAELYFGEPDVFVAAKHLCGLPGVSLREQPTIRYTHFMFDRHEIVRANGALAEAFFLSKQSADTLEKGARDELMSLFPSLRSGTESFGATAALALKSHEAELLRSSLR